MSRVDCDNLLNALLPFAQEMLWKREAFYPFAGAITCDGECALVGAYPGSEHPHPNEIVADCIRELRKGVAVGTYRAVAICEDVKVTRPDTGERTDAIQVTLEDVDHSMKGAVNVFLPWKRDSTGTFVFGDLFSAKADSRVLTDR